MPGMEQRLSGPAIWNGRAVMVTLSEESSTGFLNVLKQPGRRKKPYYVKFKPDGEKRQRTLPGSSSASAWEAACKYGYYLTTKAELPEIETRNTRRSSEVSCGRCVFCTCSRALTRLLCCVHRKCRRRRRPSAWTRPRSSPPSGRQRCPQPRRPPHHARQCR